MSVSLAKGQNGPLDVSDVVVSVQLAAAADLSALLVTSNGKVRSDADFVFFNQPTGPGVQLVPNPGGIASLRVSLAGVPADIEQVRAVITLDDASSNFGRTAAPTAQYVASLATPLDALGTSGRWLRCRGWKRFGRSSWSG